MAVRHAGAGLAGAEIDGGMRLEKPVPALDVEDRELIGCPQSTAIPHRERSPDGPVPSIFLEDAMSVGLRRAPLAFVFMILCLASTTSAQQPVLAGLDFLETMRDDTFEDLSTLSFLCPGCQVIGSPIIRLRGLPLEDSPHCPGSDLGNTDTIVRRMASTPPLFPGNDATVPIELVELHLQSVQPFQVNCQGQDQLWMLDVSISSTVQQPTGQMIIRKTHPNGGTFDSFLNVRPLLTFTRVDQCPYAVVCTVPGPIIQFQTQNVPWSHQPPPNRPVLEIPGCTTNFIPGIDTSGLPLVASGGSFSEAAMLRRHGVLPPLPPKLEQHSWQDAVHFTFWLTNHGGKDGVGPVDAIRILRPRWVPMTPAGSLADSTVYLKSNSICNLDPLWTPAPTSWCRVNWDSLDTALYRREAWWFFQPVPPGGMAPEMDLVFSVPNVICGPPVNGAWYEVDYECYSNCVLVDRGTFRFHCDPLDPTDVTPPPVRLRVGNILQQNFPNPFNPTTTIRFTLKEAGNVKLTVYTARGEVVRTLSHGNRGAGTHEIEWDGRDDAGRQVESGTYFYEIDAGKEREARKMIIVK